MMKMRPYGAVLLALLVTVCEGATIYVNGETGDDAWDGLCETWDGGSCGPKATIQMGIFAASDGDTVIVADGLYTGPWNKALDFGGLAITVRSASGDPDTCIIDCEGDGRGFQFHFGEGPESIVEGFTITNGYVTEEGGGAILCRDGSSPTIGDCVMTDSVADSTPGGAVRCYEGSSPVLVDCEVVGNVAWIGGAVSSSASSPTIVSCVLDGNSAISSGAFVGGGAVHASGAGAITLVGSFLIGNWANRDGGGVRCDGSDVDLTLANCTIVNNSAGHDGAGLYIKESGSATITNCLITGNSASHHGGAIYCWYTDPTFRNCTVSANSAGEYGGGVHCDSFSHPTFVSCILWGDSADEGPEVALRTASSLTVTYTDVEGGWAWAHIESGCTLDWGEGNIVADPVFVDPDGPDDDPATWEDNDFHLGAVTLCVDGGDPDFVPEPDETDIDGQTRVWDGDGDGVAVVDIGADEYVPGEEFSSGDLNCDGLLDFFDIDAFVLAVTFPSEYAGVYPDCDIMLADCNQDGLVDFFDIDAFVAIIVGQ